MNAYDYSFKILILGDSGVGKTCLLLRFCEDLFMDNHITTLGLDYKMKVVEVEEKIVKLTVWDSAGQERFRTITKQFYKNCEGIVLAYDITDRSSFNSIEQWIKQVKENVDSNFPLIIIGNKNDLTLKRSILLEEGQSLGKKNNVPFYETSAKESYQVKEVFLALIKLLIIKNDSSGSGNSVNFRGSRIDGKINKGKRYCCK